MIVSLVVIVVRHHTRGSGVGFGLVAVGSTAEHEVALEVLTLVGAL